MEKRMVACCICGKETPSSVVYEDNDMRIVKCHGCGLMYQNPQLPEGQIQETSYQPDYFQSYETVEERQRMFFKNKFQNVFEKVGNGKVLDVGCGIGTFLSVVQELGLEPHGVEVSEWACQIAEKKWGLHVFNGLLEQARFEDDTFDIVHMNHVLEHCAHPISVLSEVKRVLKPNGMLFVEVPYEENFKIRLWLQNLLRGILIKEKLEPLKPFREHLFLYSDKTIGRIIEQSGLDLVSIRVEGFSNPQRFNASVMKPNWKTDLLSFFLQTQIDVIVGLGSFVSVEATRH